MDIVVDNSELFLKAGPTRSEFLSQIQNLYAMLQFKSQT